MSLTAFNRMRLKKITEAQRVEPVVEEVKEPVQPEPVKEPQVEEVPVKRGSARGKK